MATHLTRVQPAEAYALLEQGYVYIDVRSEGEFLEGHPPGACNVPILHTDESGTRVPNPDFLSVMEANFPKDAKLLLGCRSGQRSTRAAEILRSAGYTHLAELRTGFDGVRDPFGAVVEKGWKASGLPVAYEPAPGCSYDDLRRKVG
ncbi:MAG: rhodanese-like domain-containing protein [Myxococcales bacterium]|nr:rhodanese-like domain-containing protein [Myxococcales bacterium]